MSGNCQPSRWVLARGPFCAVEECSCGVLHVTFGVLTIRLQREVVASIWETLGEALARGGAKASATEEARAPGSGRPS